MTISYKYTIISVDEATKTMEISYEADGYPTMMASGRLPYNGETIEAVVSMYSPVRIWEDMTKTHVVPTVGTSGTIVPLQYVPPPEPVIVTVPVQEV